MSQSVQKRRVPRRVYETIVGVLYRGEYTMERTFQVSEGGLMIGCERPLSEGDSVVLNFHVPGETPTPVLVRGVVRNVKPAEGTTPIRYSLEFANLEFSAKREIRNFVAEATLGDSQSSI